MTATVAESETRSIAERLAAGDRVGISELVKYGAAWDLRDLPLGSMEPTHELVPEAAYSHGPQVLELAQMCGYDLYQFQQEGLLAKLGVNVHELRDGSIVERWAAQETADVISRRNGKSVEIEVLILAGLFYLDEQLIMYTAHRDDTAAAVFNHVRAAIERTPELRAQLAKNGFRVANGQRSISLKSGAVAFFRTRTNESARGQGFNRLILDEAQDLTEVQMAALMPVVSGAENAQINYAGSAGGLGATVMAKVWRSFERKERGLCYRGWHADTDAEFDDLALIARNNPRLGRGLDYEFVAKEFARMTRAAFGRERCGAATYPREKGAEWVIPEAAWQRALDEGSAIADTSRPHFVLEADPELAMGTLSVAGRRADGAIHVETVKNDPGVGWLIEAAKKARGKNAGDVWLDPGGPCGFMIDDLRTAGVPVRLFRTEDIAAAWSWLYTAANPQPDPQDPKAPIPPPTVHHHGATVLTQALAAAETRKIRDKLTLRRAVAADVNQGPIVGAMLAGYAVVKSERMSKEPPPSKTAATSGAAHTRQHVHRGGTSDLATARF